MTTQFGNPHCDTPFSLFRSMLDEISKVARDAAFVISTGDVPSREFAITLGLRRFPDALFRCCLGRYTRGESERR